MGPILWRVVAQDIVDTLRSGWFGLFGHATMSSNDQQVAEAPDARMSAREFHKIRERFEERILRENTKLRKSLERNAELLRKAYKRIHNMSMKAKQSTNTMKAMKAMKA